MFKRLELERFTVFEQANFDWASGINVLVGANGTGKTHLLKLLYCLQMCGHDSQRLTDKLANVFRPNKGSVGRLVRRKPGISTAAITTRWERQKLHVEFETRSSKPLLTQGRWDVEKSPVFIPVKEVLSFATGFISLYDKYALAFDEVYYDVIKQAYLPPLRPGRAGRPENELPLLALIQKIVGGRVSIKDDAFQLSYRNANLEMSLVAEGHRKLALIWQLIHNGSLFSNNTLFWDEPEANLNPSLMQEVVKVLLMLAESGVQVFIATHNYAFLRELDFQKSDVPTRFFALEDTGNGVIPHAAESYRDIKPNKIAEEYLRLYDLEIKRSLGDV